MNLTKEEINLIVAAIQQHIHPSVEIFFFGSRVDGTSRKASDLDVLLKGHEQIDLVQLSLVKEKLEESDILFKVDVLDYHRCSEQMLKNISKNLVKISG